MYLSLIHIQMCIRDRIQGTHHFSKPSVYGQPRLPDSRYPSYVSTAHTRSTSERHGTLASAWGNLTNYYTVVAQKRKIQNKLIPEQIQINTKHDTIFKALNIENTQNTITYLSLIHIQMCIRDRSKLESSIRCYLIGLGAQHANFYLIKLNKRLSSLRFCSELLSERGSRAFPQHVQAYFSTVLVSFIQQASVQLQCLSSFLLMTLYHVCVWSM